MKRFVFAGLLAGGGYLAYDAYRAGYHTRPNMPEGAFSISYKNGLRGILIDVPDDQSTRRYLGFPQAVPFYLEDAWAFCRPPTGDEIQYADSLLRERNWPGERFEAVCKITVDAEAIVRGVITSVPNL